MRKPNIQQGHTTPLIPTPNTRTQTNASRPRPAVKSFKTLAVYAPMCCPSRRL
jgi:hypothetical protein